MRSPMSTPTDTLSSADDSGFWDQFSTRFSREGTDRLRRLLPPGQDPSNPGIQVSGLPAVGEDLTVLRDPSGGGAFAGQDGRALVQWHRAPTALAPESVRVALGGDMSFVPIPGATNASYTVQRDDVNFLIKVEVRPQDGRGGALEPSGPVMHAIVGPVKRVAARPGREAAAHGTALRTPESRNRHLGNVAGQMLDTLRAPREDEATSSSSPASLSSAAAAAHGAARSVHAELEQWRERAAELVQQKAWAEEDGRQARRELGALQARVVRQDENYAALKDQYAKAEDAGRAALEAEREQWQSEVRRQREDIAVGKEELRQERQDLRDLKAELNKRQKDLTDAEAKVQANLEQIETERVKLLREKAATSAALAEMTAAERGALQSEVAVARRALEAEREEWRRGLEGEQRAAEEERGRLTEEIQAATRAMAEAERSIAADMEEERARFEAEKSEARAEAERIETEHMEALAEMRTQLDAEADELKMHRSAFDSEAAAARASLDAEREELSKMLDSQRAAADQASRHEEELKQRGTALEAEFQALEASRADLAAAYEELSSHAEEQEAATRDLNAKLREIDEGREQAAGDLAASREAIAQEAKSLLRDLMQTAEEQGKSMQAALAQEAELKEHQEKLQQDSMGLEAEFASLHDFSAQMDEMQEKLGRDRAQVDLDRMGVEAERVALEELEEKLQARGLELEILEDARRREEAASSADTHRSVNTLAHERSAVEAAKEEVAAAWRDIEQRSAEIRSERAALEDEQERTRRQAEETAAARALLRDAQLEVEEHRAALIRRRDESDLIGASFERASAAADDERERFKADESRRRLRAEDRLLRVGGAAEDDEEELRGANRKLEEELVAYATLVGSLQEQLEAAKAEVAREKATRRALQEREESSPWSLHQGQSSSRRAVSSHAPHYEEHEEWDRLRRQLEAVQGEVLELRGRVGVPQHSGEEQASTAPVPPGSFTEDQHSTASAALAGADVAALSPRAFGADHSSSTSDTPPALSSSELLLGGAQRQEPPPRPSSAPVGSSALNRPIPIEVEASSSSSSSSSVAAAAAAARAVVPPLTAPPGPSVSHPTSIESPSSTVVNLNFSGIFGDAPQNHQQHHHHQQQQQQQQQHHRHQQHNQHQQHQHQVPPAPQVPRASGAAEPSSRAAPSLQSPPPPRGHRQQQQQLEAASPVAGLLSGAPHALPPPPPPPPVVPLRLDGGEGWPDNNNHHDHDHDAADTRPSPPLMTGEDTRPPRAPADAAFAAVAAAVAALASPSPPPLQLQQPKRLEGAQARPSAGADGRIHWGAEEGDAACAPEAPSGSLETPPPPPPPPQQHVRDSQALPFGGGGGGGVYEHMTAEELSEVVREKDGEVERVRAELEALQASKDEMGRFLVQVAAEWEASKANYEADKSLIQAEREKHGRRQKDLERDKKFLMATIGEMESREEEWQKKVEDFEHQGTTWAAKSSRWAAERKDLKAQIKALGDKCKDLDRDRGYAADLHASNMAGEMQVWKLEQDKWEGRRAKWKVKKANLREIVSKLQEDLRKCEEDRAAWKNKAEGLQAGLEDLTLHAKQEEAELKSELHRVQEALLEEVNRRPTQTPSGGQSGGRPQGGGGRGGEAVGAAEDRGLGPGCTDGPAAAAAAAPRMRGPLEDGVILRALQDDLRHLQHIKEDLLEDVRLLQQMMSPGFWEVLGSVVQGGGGAELDAGLEPLPVVDAQGPQEAASSGGSGEEGAAFGGDIDLQLSSDADEEHEAAPAGGGGSGGGGEAAEGGAQGGGDGGFGMVPAWQYLTAKYHGDFGNGNGTGGASEGAATGGGGDTLYQAAATAWGPVAQVFLPDDRTSGAAQALRVRQQWIDGRQQQQQPQQGPVSKGGAGGNGSGIRASSSSPEAPLLEIKNGPSERLVGRRSHTPPQSRPEAEPRETENRLLEVRFPSHKFPGEI